LLVQLSIFYYYLPFSVCCHHMLHSVFVTWRLCELQISINYVELWRFFSPAPFIRRYIPTLYTFRVSSSHLPGNRRLHQRALSYARELHSGLSSGYPNQRIDRPCRPWETVARRIVYVSTKLDRLNFEKAPPRCFPCCYSRDPTVASCAHIYTCINRRPASVGGPPTEIERFFPLQASNVILSLRNVSKMDILLLPCDIYRSSRAPR